MSDKYKIIKGKDIDAPMKYTGKHAELQEALDQMEDGDCVFVSTQDEVTTCIGHSKSKAFRMRGYRIRSRRVSRNPEDGYHVWKLKTNN
tara:strand:- start:26 stop:292 length:267 start_codon:yes stop_codon:yes gene_type:complete